MLFYETLLYAKVTLFKHIIKNVIKKPCKIYNNIYILLMFDLVMMVDLYLLSSL